MAFNTMRAFKPDPKNTKEDIVYLAEVRTHWTPEKELLVQARHTDEKGNPSSEWATIWTHPKTEDSPCAADIQSWIVRRISGDPLFEIEEFLARMISNRLRRFGYLT
jgi:hypothetical protein